MEVEVSLDFANARSSTSEINRAGSGIAVEDPEAFRPIEEAERPEFLAEAIS